MESNSSQKYANITSSTEDGGDSFKRESSVASASNVAMNKENSRSFTPSMGDSQPSDINQMRKNFENF